MLKNFMKKRRYNKKMTDFFYKIRYMNKFKTFVSNGKLIKRCELSRSEEVINSNFIAIVSSPDERLIYIDSVCVCKIELDIFDKGTFEFARGFDEESQEKLYDLVLNSVEYDGFYKKNEKDVSVINDILKNI